MEGDGVGSCFGAGDPLSGVCCCCCAREDLRYSVFGSGFASVSGEIIFPSEYSSAMLTATSVVTHVPAKRAFPARLPPELS